jgi:heat shock protein HslJ
LIPIRGVATAVLLTFVVAACGGVDGERSVAAGPEPVDGDPMDVNAGEVAGVPEREWVLMHSYGPRRDIVMVEVREADGSPVVTLDTRQGAVGTDDGNGTLSWRGHDGCADVEVEVEVDGSSVAVFGDVPAGEELGGCSTARGEAAVAYAEALLDVDRWEVRGELLEMTGSETWMVFEPLVVDDPPAGLVDPADADLWDRRWVATSVTEDGAPVALVDGTELTVSLDRFQGHATLGFSAGCNSFGGQLWITPRTLRLVDGGGTEMGCDGPLERQDGYFARYFFRSTLDWELVGDQLTLTDGSTVIELEDESAQDEQD